MSHQQSLTPAFVVALSFALAACGSASKGAAPALPIVAPGAQAPVPISQQAATGKIKHVVIIMQENRSFNNLLDGFPGAKTQSYGYDSNGNKIDLVPIPLEAKLDLEHDSTGFFAACNGTGSIPGTDCQMNGFNQEKVYYCSASCAYKNPQYAYVPRSEVKPYFAMGEQYVVADQMYASNFDSSSFVSHQYIIAGQAETSVDYPATGPWGCSAPKSDTIKEVGKSRQIPVGYERPCWNTTTLCDELDDAKISWAFYARYERGAPYVWTAPQVIKHLFYGKDWTKDVITPETQILKDISYGNLRTVNWVTPEWTNSDHPDALSNTGPSWVASVVNAIGQSKYWKSTVIFIFWDDYGGWYDPEPPGYVDYDGLGMRLPMIIVSAYAKKGYVSHKHYEHGTILKFIERTFGLKALAATDKRANLPDDAFDFNQPPRKFKVIPSQYGRGYFLNERPDHHPVDDN